jgi:MFS family permease
MTSTDKHDGINPNNNQYRYRLSKIYPWVVVLFSSLFLFYKYILQVSPSVMTNDLMLHFHVNATGLGNLAATFFYAYLVVQLFVGPLLDKYSPRTLTALALAASALAALWFANAQSLLSASLARGLVGAATAFATISYMKMGTLWFKPEKFPFVSGLLATAAMLGSMAGQVPLGYMIMHVGWQLALFYSSVAGLALSGLYYVCVKDKTLTATALTITAPKSKDFLKLLKQKDNWLLLFYSGLAFSPLAVFGGLWGNPFLQEAYHASKSQAGLLVSCSFVGLAVGGPFLGWLSGRLNKQYEVMWFGLVLSLVSLSTAVYVPGLNDVLEGLSLLLFGFGTGAFMLGFVMGKVLNSVTLAASVVALINTGDAVFGAFSEPLAGKILDYSWNGKIVHGVHYFSVHDYHLALLMLPLYLGLAGLFLFGLKKNRNLF